MKISLFNTLIAILELSRGPKPKAENVLGAQDYLTGKSNGTRYGRRIAARIMEINEAMKEYDGTSISALKVYIVLNGIQKAKSVLAVRLVYSDGYTPSRASVEVGTYSALVYSLYNSVEDFKKLCDQWEKNDGRNYNA